MVKRNYGNAWSPQKIIKITTNLDSPLLRLLTILWNFWCFKRYVWSQVGKTGEWMVSQLDCPKVQTLTKPQVHPMLLPLSSQEPARQLDSAPTSSRTSLLWCSSHQPARRWVICIQTRVPPLSSTRLFPSKIHSAAQPLAPEHTSCGQASSSTPGDYTGTGTNHNSWMNRQKHKSHQLEKRKVNTHVRIHSTIKKAK